MLLINVERHLNCKTMNTGKLFNIPKQSSICNEKDMPSNGTSCLLAALKVCKWMVKTRQINIVVSTSLKAAYQFSKRLSWCEMGFTVKIENQLLPILIVFLLFTLRFIKQLRQLWRNFQGYNIVLLMSHAHTMHRETKDVKNPYVQSAECVAKGQQFE